MSKVIKHNQTIFTQGPLSDRCLGRVDNDAYKKSLKDCLNMRLLPQGSAVARDGSVYVGEVKTSADECRLIEFEFNSNQTYLIELGDQYARFYKDRAQIESGGSPYEIVTPWLHTELSELSYFQSGDVIYFLHNSHQMTSLARVDDTNWTLQTVEFRNGPWNELNDDETLTITPSATTGVGITLTASSALFASTDVGRLVRYKNTGTADWGWAEITAFTSDTVVTATVRADFAATAASDLWQFSLYGGGYGWPSVGTIHEERFIVGGSITRAFRGTASQTGLYGVDYVDFGSSEADGQVIDSNGFIFDLTSDKIDEICWMASSRVLLVGTSSSEYSVSGNGTSSRTPISPSDKLIQRESNFGSKKFVRPQKVGNSVIYTDVSGLKVRELYYDYSVDSYISKDSTVFNSGIFEGGIVATAFQKNPDTIIWMVRGDGCLVGFTFEKVNEVEGMHPHCLGGDGDHKILDIASIIRPDGVANDVYLLVERKIGGSTVKYIEYLSEMFEEIVDVKEALFLDSAVSVVNSPASVTVSGLDHLEGETVSVLADGSPVQDATVSSGEITLVSPAEKVKVGYGYSKFLDLLPPEYLQLGTIMGSTSKIVKGWVYITNSVGLKIGSEYIEGLDPVPFNGTNNDLNQPAPLFTGIKVFHPPSGYAITNSITIQNDNPLPFMVNYVVQQIEIND